MRNKKLLGGAAVLAGVVMVKLGEGEGPAATAPAHDVDAAVQAATSADADSPRSGTGLSEPERVH